MFQTNPPDPLAVKALWISGVAAVFAFLQWLVGMRSARAAERSARASEESARAARMSQRPWVNLMGFDPGGFELAEEMTVRAQVTNVGTSPALDCVSDAKLALFPTSAPEKLPELPIDEDEGRGILTAGNAFAMHVKISLTPKEIDAIREGFRVLLLFGYARYKDAWGDAHETRWCLKYAPNTNGFGHTQKHNSAT